VAQRGGVAHGRREDAAAPADTTDDDADDALAEDAADAQAAADVPAPTTPRQRGAFACALQASFNQYYGGRSRPRLGFMMAQPIDLIDVDAKEDEEEENLAIPDPAPRRPTAQLRMDRSTTVAWVRTEWPGCAQAALCACRSRQIHMCTHSHWHRSSDLGMTMGGPAPFRDRHKHTGRGCRSRDRAVPWLAQANRQLPLRRARRTKMTLTWPQKLV